MSTRFAHTPAIADALTRVHAALDDLQVAIHDSMKISANGRSRDVVSVSGSASDGLCSHGFDSPHEVGDLACDGPEIGPGKVREYSHLACDREGIAAVLALESAQALIDARRYNALVRAAGAESAALNTRRPENPERDVRISDVRAVELGAIINCSPNRIRNLVDEARTLTTDLRMVHQHLEQGRISGYFSRIAFEGWRDLARRHEAAGVEISPITRSRFQTRIMMRASGQTATEFRRTVRAAVSLLSPAEHVAAQAAAREERYIVVQPATDGMAYLNAYLPIADASRIWQMVTHIARNDRNLAGNQNQKMVDAFVKLLDGTADVSKDALRAAGELQVMVSFDAMRETAEALLAGRMPERALCGEIVGTGLLIEGQALLDMFADAKFRRLVYDPKTGQLLDYGRETYRPPKNLDDHIRHRDKTCRVPGCVRPAASGDVDHIQSWDSGGTTSADNLAVLCRTHHVLKTHGGWEYFLTADGVARWQTPSGMTLDRTPSNCMDLVPGFALPDRADFDDATKHVLATALMSGSWLETAMAGWLATGDSGQVELESDWPGHDTWKNSVRKPATT